MFEFIRDYFNGKPNGQQRRDETATLPRQDNRHSISYDPGLIGELESDHAHLVRLFGRIWTEGFDQADYDKTSTLIREFKTDFQAHLLTENVKFYVYLEQLLADDPHNLQIVKEFRADMNEIANAVVRFCKTYQKTFDSVLIRKFKDDYTAVGEVLARRVSLEEKSLYVLYRPH